MRIAMAAAGVACLLALSAAAAAPINTDQQTKPGQCARVAALVANSDVGQPDWEAPTDEWVTQQLAQSGCCSWHNGVCGCANGRVVCCDNTYSPSCKC